LTCRKYALRLFFRFLIPTRSTVFIEQMVATSSYLVKPGSSWGSSPGVGWDLTRFSLGQASAMEPASATESPRRDSP
jgi:hypothetical protein